ncbi:MAG: tetratricopeptide repeat protein [Bacteroidia bacterium]
MVYKILSILFLFVRVQACAAQLADSTAALQQQRRLDSLYEQGRYAEAGLLADTAIASWERLGNWVQVQQCRKVRLYSLGLAGRLGEAKAELERMENLCEAHFAQRDPAWGQLYNSRVALHVWNGDFMKAVGWSERQQDFWKNRRNIDAAAAFINRGIAYFYIASPWESIESSQQGLAILDSLGEQQHIFAANAYLCIGRSYLSLRHFKESEQYFLKALDLYQQLLRPGHPNLIVANQNLASLYFTREDYRAAEKKARQNLQTSLQYLGKHSYTAQDYFNLGRALLFLEHYDEALAKLARALEIQQELLPSSHPSIAMTRLYIGRVYRAKKQFDASFDMYQKALSEVKDDRNSGIHADLYIATGLLFQDWEKWGDALVWFDKCLSNFRKEGKWLSIAHKRGIIELLGNKAFVLTQMNSRPDSQRFRLAAETLIEGRDLLDSMRYFIRPEEEAFPCPECRVYLQPWCLGLLSVIPPAGVGVLAGGSIFLCRKTPRLSAPCNRFAAGRPSHLHASPARLLQTERRAQTGLLQRTTVAEGKAKGPQAG